ncbi:teichoic acid D-Ala incorporation-associated protein DltX [Leuconostoc holzapfelii]|uniref:Teichoic acid D-Ala incorporation-associated protein DltX n=1 Tax=Leuconostoc holzapfelii TaxID=434464 RepID=A0ABT2NVX2_9LACO|nr:teichoic acid D-Ala incorporation-associated protein DltX [Leuconostoc holzapfelii]MCT8388531.1 teichoic acid D-Ala incorporation-associated protein DltX [Leuconostoc holzapfelii]
MIKRFFQRPVVNFISRTLFYFSIILMLVYLYSYSGVGQGHFIYNEF